VLRELWGLGEGSGGGWGSLEGFKVEEGSWSEMDSRWVGAGFRMKLEGLRVGLSNRVRVGAHRGHPEGLGGVGLGKGFECEWGA